MKLRIMMMATSRFDDGNSDNGQVRIMEVIGWHW